MSGSGRRQLDRRHARHDETVEHLLRCAVEIMAERGVAGLSLGEVARRFGVKPPSLYEYFPSKNAVYDALFARGWERLLYVLDDLPQPDESSNTYDYLLLVATTFVHWSVTNPVDTQLMMWRPVPGYEPSPAAMTSAVRTADGALTMMSRLQQLNLLREDIGVDELFRVWTVLLSGVVTQQLANAPGQPFDSGAFTSLLPQLICAYATHYAHPKEADRS